MAQRSRRVAEKSLQLRRETMGKGAVASCGKMNVAPIIKGRRIGGGAHTRGGVEEREPLSDGRILQQCVGPTWIQDRVVVAVFRRIYFPKFLIDLVTVVA